MSTTGQKEVSRQYRVLGQMISMHSMLRNKYEGRAFFVDVVLIACSIIFCATTFVCDETIAKTGLPIDGARYALGVAAIVAFFASIVSLRADWKGAAAGHARGVDRLTKVIALFREKRSSDKGWPVESLQELSKAYWEGMDNTLPIPEKAFLSLKRRHLIKVEISTLSGQRPGCPLWILRLVLFWKSIWPKRDD